MGSGRENLDLSQTIFALTTGNLPSAVAVERVSGPDAFDLARKLFNPVGGKPFEKSRGIFLGELHDVEGKKIDQVLMLAFVSPHSYSGEDTIEFHCHGSIPIIRRLEQVLLELGARPAERGEFSYRAHLNGKLSAGELEGLGDVYLARQVSDLTSIYSRRDGAVETQIDRLRNTLIRLQAILDTAIDFSEEYSAVIHAAEEPLDQVIRECSELIQRYSAFKTGVVSPRIVLAGRSNAGKSSLFNSLLCRYRAIVHEEPGTTRDVIEEDLDIGGRLWKLVDTAGVRENTAGVEKEGISMGEDFLSSASFWLLVVDGTNSLSAAEKNLLDRFCHIPHLIAWNKKDSAGWVLPPAIVGEEFVSISAKTGEGTSALWDRVKDKVLSIPFSHQGALPTAVQCLRLERVVVQLQEIRGALRQNVPAEYIAEQNRSVLGQLESVIGDVGTEDILDRVFGEFCIGK